MTKPILEFRDLTKSFPVHGGAAHVVLDSLNLSIEKEEFVTLVGPSGCGKSTLFNLILGSMQPTSGKVLLDGVPVEQPGPDRGIVYQRYGLFPHLTVLENVMLAGSVSRFPKMHLFSREAREKRADDKERALKYLERVHLADAAKKYPHELSGGMQQRVAIAQTLFARPKVLLMDEPFGALDPGTRHDAQLFLLEMWEKYDLTIIFVTHSLEEAVYLGTRVLALSQHYEHEEGPHRRDNGAEFVIDYDLSAYVPKRHAANMSFEQYVGQFEPEMDAIQHLAMDPRVRQHVSQFRVGDPVLFRKKTG